MGNNFFVPGPDGKPQFIGRDDPHNPPNPLTSFECKHGTPECSHMQCPVDGEYVDYLVGDDTPDGGKRACEGHYKPSQMGVERGLDIPSDKDMGL